VTARRVAVVTDSTADLPPELARRRGITSVPLTLNFDGRSYLDGVEITPEDFYARLPSASQHPTTSQPSAGRFAEVYRKLLQDHQAVVSLHISSKLSGTYASAVQGAELADGGRIQVVDTEVVSMPLGLLALVAAQVAEQGAAPAQVLEAVERVRSGLKTYFSLGTLEFLRRGGRIGRASALLGSVLQVKPVLAISDGEVAPLERVRTFERALRRVGELARGVDGGQGICAIVGHSAAEDSARQLAAGLKDAARVLMIQPLGPVVGAHAGPGTVGVGCYPAQLFNLSLPSG